MNLLAGTLYDPAVAVSKATTSLIAMTALDTTNLRLTGTVPPSGKIYWKIKATLHGATTYPQVMLGVLSGASVVARMAAMLSGGNLAATTVCACWAEGIITGTPGAAFTYDAAYGVETVVASTGLKYGGPNNTTGNDNWGGIAFELWDACPTFTPSSGAAPTTTVHGKLDTNATNLSAVKTKTDFLPSATAGAAGGVFIAGSNAATTVNFTGNLSGSVGSVTGAVGSVTGLTAANLDVAVSTRLATAGYTAPPSAAANATAVRSELTTELARIDVATSTRLATAGYTAPDNATITAIAGYVDTEVAAIKGVVDKLDTALELNGAVYRFTAGALALGPTGTEPDNVGIAAIQAKTDLLAFTAGNLDVHVKAVNSVAIIGTGAPGDLFRVA